LSEYSSTNRPQNARELFNLRHSSLRVSVERAFGALKNRFRILYSKPFHPYKTQVKLVIACCILHNWILGFGVDHIVPDEDWLPPNHPPVEPDQDQEDSVAMTQKRDDICNAMWAGRGTNRT
jgi:hypothetical protein